MLSAAVGLAVLAAQAHAASGCTADLNCAGTSSASVMPDSRREACSASAAAPLHAAEPLLVHVHAGRVPPAALGLNFPDL